MDYWTPPNAWIHSSPLRHTASRMDAHNRTAMAAYEPKRIEREGIERAAVLVAVCQAHTIEWE